MEQWTGFYLNQSFYSFATAFETNPLPAIVTAQTHKGFYWIQKISSNNTVVDYLFKSRSLSFLLLYRETLSWLCWRQCRILKLICIIRQCAFSFNQILSLRSRSANIKTLWVKDAFIKLTNLVTKFWIMKVKRGRFITKCKLREYLQIQLIFLDVCSIRQILYDNWSWYLGYQVNCELSKWSAPKIHA
jgi:hypothetical protein